MAELGFDNTVMQEKQVVGQSAHSGTTPEVVLTQVDAVEGHTYLMVLGHNGAFSPDAPYALQVETSVPQDLLQSAIDQEDPPAALVSGANETAASIDMTPSIPNPPPPLTLFVTQAQRIDALYADDQERQPFQHVVLPALEAACRSDLVRGRILLVPSDIYDNQDYDNELYRRTTPGSGWDEAPWDTTKANAVAERIRSVVQDELSEYPSIKYVVLVGSDAVIPQRRVNDGTVAGNERAYAIDSLVDFTSPLFAAMYSGKILTDDYYVDTSGISFNNDYLYVPTKAVSRLIETPSEIAYEIQGFLGSGGRLAGGSSVVTGQDFLTDCGNMISSILQAAGASPVPGQTEDWSLAQLKTDLFDAHRNVASINAHADHYRILTAAGSHALNADPNADASSEVLYGSDIAGVPNFLGKLFFSAGCHAGLNVPDRAIDLPSYYVAQVDPRLDLAQAMARQQGVLVGNTGYGFGDYETISAMRP